MLIERRATATLEEFADQHGLALRIHENPVGWNPGPWVVPGERFSACFKNARVLEHGLFISSGMQWGSSEQEAIRRFANSISGGQIVKDGGKRPIDVPIIREWSDREFVAADRFGIIRHLDAWLEEHDEAADAREQAESALKKRR